MSWTLASYACATIAGGYVTLAMLAETEPFINEEGEEEYTLSGYLLLSAAYIIKWPFEKIAQLIKERRETKGEVTEIPNNQIHDWVHEPQVDTIEIAKSDNEYEIVI